MRIAIIGSGAMGMFFGGYLSKDNEVVLIDTDRAKVRTPDPSAEFRTEAD